MEEAFETYAPGVLEVFLIYLDLVCHIFFFISHMSLIHRQSQVILEVEMTALHTAITLDTMK